MTALAIQPEDDGGSAYEKPVSELQEGISITGTKISGTLKYVKGYTGFDNKNNDGNFLALKVEYPEDAEVKFTLIGGSTKDKKMDDHQLVLKIKDASAQKLKLDITKGGKTGSVTYDLSGLTLKDDEAA